MATRRTEARPRPPNAWRSSGRSRPTPATIFAVLRDPQGHVAIDSSGMLMDATGEPATRGRRHVRRPHGPRGAERLPDGQVRRDGRHHDVRARPRDRVDDRGQIKPPIGHVYGYTLEPVDGGTLVTSYYDWSDDRPDVEGGRRSSRSSPRPRCAPRSASSPAPSPRRTARRKRIRRRRPPGPAPFAGGAQVMPW